MRYVLALVGIILSVASAAALPLRVGLVEAPTAGVLFVARSASGVPEGVAFDLGADLARALDRPFAFVVFPNTGEATAALQAGTVDVAFMPVDEVRRQLVDFGPGYYDLESTYLVSGESGIADVAEVDRAGFRVVAIAGTTTFRAAARTLTVTQPKPVPSVAEAMELMRTGQADAFALSRDTLQPMLSQVPGARITTGAFQQTMVAAAVPKGHAAELAQVSDWLREAKASGLVRQVFDAHGLQAQAVGR